MLHNNTSVHAPLTLCQNGECIQLVCSVKPATTTMCLPQIAVESMSFSLLFLLFYVALYRLFFGALQSHSLLFPCCRCFCCSCCCSAMLLLWLLYAVIVLSLVVNTKLLSKNFLRRFDFYLFMFC